MKAAAFEYIRATSLDQVCYALHDGAGEAQVIAGGQTLIPLMAMRMARPEILIDINDLDELKGIEVSEDFAVIKSGTRQSEVLESTEIRETLPILSEAISHVGHTQTRNRGTIGGSLVAADPSAEIPLIAQLLEATLIARSLRGERQIQANQFFESAMMTTLEPDEFLVEVRFPRWKNGSSGHGFHETSIRDSDYALASAAAQLSLDQNRKCDILHIAVGGASPTPLRLPEIENTLRGQELSDAAIEDALQNIPTLVEPQSDVHADADYRRRLSRVLALRAITDARDRALGDLK